MDAGGGVGVVPPMTVASLHTVGIAPNIFSTVAVTSTAALPD
jgi:hypothetical protein